MRLFLKLYLTLVIAVLASLTVATMGLRSLWKVGGQDPHEVWTAVRDYVDRLPEQTPEMLKASLPELSDKLDRALVVFAPDGQVLAFTGEHPFADSLDELRPPQFDGPDAELHRERPPGEGPGRHGPQLLTAPDGRVLAMRPLFKHQPNDPMLFMVRTNLILFVILAIACWPIAHLITVRTERLRRAVEKWGKGDLRARANLEGQDEIRDVARAFNQAADRVESLLQQQHRMLASASHEFRTPLTRIRMALDLLRGPEGRDEYRDRLFVGATQDIEELDGLVGDLLLTARAENPSHGPGHVPVNLTALLAEEAGHLKIPVQGDSAILHGDARMLRRMCRNLLDNAVKYGQPERRAELQIEAGWVVLDVSDQGPGIPDSEKDKIFEPFYRPANHREATHGGVGLGLMLVRQVAMFHGGEVRCLDRPGGGTLFRVRLPLPTAPSEDSVA